MEFFIILIIVTVCFVFAYNFANDNLPQTQNSPLENKLFEQIPASALIIIRDELNKIAAIDKLSDSELRNKIEQMEQKLNETGTLDMLKGLSSFEIRQVTKELKRILNTMDLQENETMTFNDVVSRSQLKPTRNQPYQEVEDDYSEEDSLADAAAGFVAGLFVGNQSSKQKRINKLRNEVKSLDNEYKFERGFESEWYEDEHLSAKYKNRDEEKYLRARKEELRNANMAYDTYLTPDERKGDGDMGDMDDF